MNEWGNVSHDIKDDIRLAVLQRVCTSYRANLFRQLSSIPGIRLRLFYGDDIPNSKVRSANDLPGIDSVQLPTTFFKIGRSMLVWHKELMSKLEQFQPSVILTEGESNIISYLMALAYRWKHPSVALIHWSLGGLPGEPIVRKGFRGQLVNRLRNSFDALVVYSSYGKEVLVSNGINAEKVFVAVNVSDLSRHFEVSDRLSRDEARSKLTIPNRFTILFVGAMTKYKRLDVLLSAATDLAPDRYNIVLVGDGGVYHQLESEIQEKRLDHVLLIGRVTEEIESYYRAADVVALPGRGGMIISEAMAYERPVIAYQADGTEYDLVIEGETGILLKDGSPEELRSAIEKLNADRGAVERMGKRAKILVKDKFNTPHMIENILEAIHYSRERRRCEYESTSDLDS